MLRVFLKNNVVGDKLHMCVQFSKHLGNGFVVYILKSEDCAGGKKNVVEERTRKSWPRARG